MVQFCYLLHFSQRGELLSSKAAFTIDFFAAVNYNYNHKQWALNHRNTQSGLKSTNHKPWPFEPMKFYFLRDRLIWLTAAKNANVSWLLNFRICMFLKSAAILYWGIETVSCQLLLNDKDGHGLKVEKLGPTFSIFNPMTAEMSPKNIMVCAPCGRNWLDTYVFFKTLQVKHFV